LVIHDTLIIPQKKTAVLLFGKIAAFFLGNFFLQPQVLLRGSISYRCVCFFQHIYYIISIFVFVKLAA